VDGSNALHRIRIIGKILNGLYLLSYTPQFETQYNMEQHKKLKNFIKTTIREFLNENKNIEPYYNADFKKKLYNLLIKLGFEDIEFESDGVSFHNPDYDDKLVGKKSWIIYDFIDKYGYNSDDFIIRGSRIFYPSNF
jgi:hypothetical protein